MYTAGSKTKSEGFGNRARKKKRHTCCAKEQDVCFGLGDIFGWLGVHTESLQGIDLPKEDSWDG